MSKEEILEHVNEAIQIEQGILEAGAKRSE